jgi:hypothetical protein
MPSEASAERPERQDDSLRLWQLGIAFACLFLVLAFLIPTAGFYDLYLLPWQARAIITDNPNLWHAMRHSPAAYLPFTHFSALPYGPLFYYPLSCWLLILDKLSLIDLHAWADFSVAPNSLRYTALLKVPNLIVYFAVGLTLLHTLPGRAGQDAMLLWLFNPAAIIVSFVMGQNDSWSLLSVLLALLLAARELRGQHAVQLGPWRVPSAPLAMIILGAGGAVKLHPLLLMAPFAIALGSSWRERALLGAIGLATFGLLIAPFASDSFFREHALQNPQAGDIFRHRLVFLPLFIPTYALAVAPSLRRKDEGFSALLASVVAVHLLVFALTGWSPERAVWFVGALALPATMTRAGLAAYLLTTVQALLRMMQWAGSLGAGAFALLSRELDTWPGLDVALDRVWGFDHFYVICAGFALLAWSLTVLMLAAPGALRPRRVPLAVPIAVLALLPAYFGGAIAYGAGGITTALPGATAAPFAGPATVDQDLLAGSFSAIDIVYVSGSAGRPLTASLFLGDGTPTGTPASVDSADGRVRLRFGEASFPGGTYHLRLEIPAGAAVETITGFAAPAFANGEPSGRTVDLRLHLDSDWPALRSNVRHKLAQGAPVLATTGLLLAITLALVCREAAQTPRRDRPAS